MSISHETKRAKKIIVELVREAGGKFASMTSLSQAFWKAHLAYAAQEPGYLSSWPIVKTPSGPGIGDFDTLLSEMLHDGWLTLAEQQAGDAWTDAPVPARELIHLARRRRHRGDETANRLLRALAHDDDIARLGGGRTLLRGGGAERQEGQSGDGGAADHAPVRAGGRCGRRGRPAAAAGDAIPASVRAEGGPGGDCIHAGGVSGLMTQ